MKHYCSTKDPVFEELFITQVLASCSKIPESSVLVNSFVPGVTAEISRSDENRKWWINRDNCVSHTTVERKMMQHINFHGVNVMLPLNKPATTLSLSGPELILNKFV